MALNIEEKVSVTYTLDKVAVSKLKLLASTTFKRTNNVTLSSIHLESVNGTLYGEATNLDVYYRTEVTSSAVSQDDLSIVVPADTFKALKAPKKNERLDLTIVEEGQTNVLLLGALTAKGVMQENDFVKFPEWSAKWSVETLDKTYFDNLNMCSLSASTTETRPILTGICHRKNHLVATNGYVMSRIESNSEFVEDMLIPASTSKFLSKVFDGIDTFLDVGDKFAIYTNRDSTVFVRKMDGTYPDMERIINIGAKNTGTITNVEHWLAVLKDIKSMSKKITAQLTFDDECTISAKNESQEISSTLEFDGIDFGLTISFNPQYMYDALLQTGDDSTLIIDAANRPMKLVSQDGRIEVLVSPIGKR